MSNLVVFTGGGTAGHVMGNLSLIEELSKEGISSAYIGSKKGMERSLLSNYPLPYYPIATGKWRRYFSLKNLWDLFKVLKGCFDSLQILRKLRPQVIFSKGGFVSLPVVLAGWVLRIPIIIHEADFNFGLANKLALPLARKICVSHRETLLSRYVDKTIQTGLPLRAEIFQGNIERGQKIFGLNFKKPVLLITGGSLGAKDLNEAVEELLPSWIREYQIIHLHGSQFTPQFKATDYHPYVYLNQEMVDALTVADLVISRAGANTVAELLALRKVNLLVPLTKGSRGDQLFNAKKAEKEGYSMVLQGELTAKKLAEAVGELWQNRMIFTRQLAKYEVLPAQKIIIEALKEYLI